MITVTPRYGHADESGTSVWLPGSFGSLAAVPQEPGWSLATIYYHTPVWAGAGVATAREIQIGQFSPTINASLNAKLSARADLGLLVPTYVFAMPILGGQLALSVTSFFGGSTTDVSGTLSGTAGLVTFSRNSDIRDSVTNIGDVFPQASLRWNDEVHNFMTYLQLDVPVGSYQSTRLTNLSANHWAVDSGSGYTYFDQATGHELSAVAGLTYNLINPTTGYRSGVDFHLDWGASQFLSEHWHVGAVGYVYEQLTPDSGAVGRLDGFKSGVVAVGPQVGYTMSVGGHQTYINLKSYGEFDAVNRPSGWNMWLTVSTSF